MRVLKMLAVAAVVVVGFAASGNKMNAQVSVEVGPAPVCPYGYYDVPPYTCAPYGYYGPEWFADGLFIGAGPWFHGPEHFHGRVDNHFHPEHGFHGHMPERGEKAAPENHVNRMPNFHGNESRDGHGHVVKH
jgi:hypothetical protein